MFITSIVVSSNRPLEWGINCSEQIQQWASWCGIDPVFPKTTKALKKDERFATWDWIGWRGALLGKEFLCRKSMTPISCHFF